jgi:hypothetical protein
MAQFHEHPDGVVIVRAPASEYQDTRANFVTDYRWQIPAKPDWAVERLYDDAGLHKLIDAKGNDLASGPVPWEFGDKAIAAIARILERQAARRAATEAQAARELAAAIAATAPPATPVMRDAGAVGVTRF